MPDTVITLAMLEAKQACEDQRVLFAELFPNGTPKTRRAALAAARKYAGKFDLAWAAENLLRARARAEYSNVRDAAWAECEKVCAPAWAEYDKVRVAAFVNAWFNQQEKL